MKPRKIPRFHLPLAFRFPPSSPLDWKFEKTREEGILGFARQPEIERRGKMSGWYPIKFPVSSGGVMCWESCCYRTLCLGRNARARAEEEG